MKAKAAGNALFSINESETAGRGFAIFKEDAAVPATRVIFGTASVAVAQNFTDFVPSHVRHHYVKNQQIYVFIF